MSETTERPIKPAVLAWCDRHGGFSAYGQACPHCAAHHEALPSIGLTLIGIAACLTVLGLCVLALMWG